MDIATSLKKIPTPVLIGLGGGVLGLGYVAFRSRGDNTPASDPTADAVMEATPVADAEAGTTYTTTVPSGVAYVTGSGASDESASTVGAVGQTALDSLVGITNSALQLAAKQPAQVDPDLIAAIAASRAPAATMPMPQPPPPSTPATPAALAKERLPAGYHAGDSVSEAKDRKRFPGALGWARIASGGKGSKHWIDYHIRFSKGRIQRWRYTPAARGSKWRKTWG